MSFIRTILICGIAGIATPVIAGELSFVVPERLTRQAGQDYPDIIPMGKMLTAPVTFPYRHPTAEIWEPATSEIAPSPVMLSAQTGPGSAVASATLLRGVWQDSTAGAGFRLENLHSYQDAAGTRINSGFERTSEYIMAGTSVLSQGRLSVLALRDVFTEGKTPNYSLDVPQFTRDGIGLSARQIPLPGYFDNLDWIGGYKDLSMSADNFTLRAPISAHLAVENSGRQWSSAARLSRNHGAWLTAEYTHEEAEGVRYSKEYGPNVISAVRLPGTHYDRVGLEAGEKWAAQGDRMEMALRADFGRADADEADDLPNVPNPAGTVFNFSPRQLYKRYYGGDGSPSRNEAELGGRLRIEHDIGKGDTLHLDLRRAIRQPELTELYFANPGSGDLIQVGNPDLKAEKHHRGEVGFTDKSSTFNTYGRGGQAKSFRLSSSAFVDGVDDFITVDRARGQGAILRSDQGIIYRNVDAVLMGLSADLQGNLTDHLAARLNVVGQRGRNLTDDRPLYQVAPLEANLFLDAFGTEYGWNAGTRLRLVAGKRSVDDSPQTGSGEDKGGPAGGFATADVYAGYVFDKRFSLSTGVENLFNKLYREHVAAVPQTPITTLPNVPGRTLFIRGVLAF